MLLRAPTTVLTSPWMDFWKQNLHFQRLQSLLLCAEISLEKFDTGTDLDGVKNHHLCPSIISIESPVFAPEQIKTLISYRID